MNNNFTPTNFNVEKGPEPDVPKKEKWRETAAILAEKVEKYTEISAEMIAMSKKRDRIKKAWKQAPELIKWSSCVLYYRRSTNKQDTTIETQQKECIKKANELKLSITKEYYEEISGKTEIEERDAMTKMIEEIKPGEVLIVYSVSRIARQIDVFYNIMRLLKDKGCRVICCHENLDSIDPHMEMIWAVHVAFAQQERQAIGSRTSAALQTMKARGLAVHRPRWGYRIDPDTKKFVTIPEIQNFINIMINMRRQGCSLAGIVNLINDMGIPTPSGKQVWDVKSVSTILKREMGKEEAEKYNKKPGFGKKMNKEDIAELFNEEEEKEEAEEETPVETETTKIETTEESEVTKEVNDEYDSLALPMLKLRIMRRKGELGITDQDIASMTRDEIIFTLRYN